MSRRFFLSVWAVLLFCCWDGAVWAEKWQRLDSDFVTLYYDEGVSLSDVNNRIVINPVLLKRYRAGVIKGDASADVRTKLDVMFQRVQDVLGMGATGASVNVKLYSNEQSLRSFYRKRYGKEYRNMKGQSTVLSFYIFKDNTIYLYAQHLNTSVLAHEIGHCVIDHYFIMMPPVKVQEILAMYVDKHFSD